MVETIYEDIKQFFRIVRYGWLLDYHLSKRKISSDHRTVLKYHLEMSEHYYEKIWGSRHGRK